MYLMCHFKEHLLPLSRARCPESILENKTGVESFTMKRWAPSLSSYGQFASALNRLSNRLLAPALRTTISFGDNALMISALRSSCLPRNSLEALSANRSSTSFCLVCRTNNRSWWLGLEYFREEVLANLTIASKKSLPFSATSYIKLPRLSSLPNAGFIPTNSTSS